MDEKIEYGSNTPLIPRKREGSIQDEPKSRGGNKKFFTCSIISGFQCLCFFAICVVCCLVFFLGLLFAIGFVVELVIILYPHLSVEEFKLRDVSFAQFELSSKTIYINYTVHLNNFCAYSVEVNYIDMDISRDGKVVGEATLNYEGMKVKISKYETSDFVLLVALDATQFDRATRQSMVLEYLRTHTIVFDFEGHVKGDAMGFPFSIPYSGNT